MVDSITPTQLEDMDYLLNRIDDPSLKAKFARILNSDKVIVGQYNFATQGGAVSAINIKDVDGNDVVLPAGYIVKRVFAYTVAAVTTSASGTLSLGYSGAVTALMGVTAASDMEIGEFVLGAPIETIATMLAISSAKTVQVDIATGALTAGKVNFFIELCKNPS